jgi:hypothetical protein
MRVKLVLPAVMASMISCSVWATEAVEKPDMDLLEYLGTYETARGKEIDPMLLEKSPVENPRSKAATPKKKETKRNEPRKKEDKDD